MGVPPCLTDSAPRRLLWHVVAPLVTCWGLNCTAEAKGAAAEAGVDPVAVGRPHDLREVPTAAPDDTMGASTCRAPSDQSPHPPCNPLSIVAPLPHIAQHVV